MQEVDDSTVPEQEDVPEQSEETRPVAVARGSHLFIDLRLTHQGPMVTEYLPKIYE